MNIRRELLLTGYDFWLDYYGTPGCQRKELRRELRANLDQSAADRGWEAARDGLGSIRLLARESADSVRDPHRPSWNTGAILAALVFASVMLLHFWSMLAFVDGATAVGLPDGRQVTGSVTLLPGSRFTAMKGGGDGFAISFGLFISPWLMFGLPLLGWLLGTRIWRLVRR